nr:NAD(P)H-hydrate dehydratase [Schlegelella koreensis]
MHGAAATRRLEASAAAALPPFELMARAGLAVARLALALAPHARSIDVRVGHGNNGGDGLEAAAWLRRWGKDVRVRAVPGFDARLPTDAARALARARDAGVPIVDAADAAGAPAALVVDALLGIGANRAPDGALAGAIEAIGRDGAAGAIVLAVDAPSGLDVTRGHPLGDGAVVAQHTLSLLTLKPGLFTAAGRDHAGTVWLDTLNCDCGAEPPDALLVGAPATRRVPRRHAGHKGSFGDVVVVGGDTSMSGAALLAARAAQAAGAGRVYLDLLDPGAAEAGHDPLRPELMWRSRWWHDATPGQLAAATLVCGCGGGARITETLPRLLEAACRLVLDADALNAIASDPALQQALAARGARGCRTVLTPHPLEAARLLGRTTAEVQADRVAAATELVRRFDCVALLKGSGSVLAAPGVVPRINATGNASLASAGTGDVLAGWIGGWWAQDATAGGEALLEIVATAVATHGAAAGPRAAGAWRAADLVDRLALGAR